MIGLPKTNMLFGFIPLYGLCIVTGMVLAIFFAVKEEKRLQLPKDTVIDCALIVLPAGIIGARLYFVLFNWSFFSSDLLRIFQIRSGGLGIYGGLIAGIVALIAVAKHKKISALLLLDLLIPGVALAQSIGRWGNYFNMEAYGSQVFNPALQFFPFAVPIISGTTVSWHLATFFYESCVTFLLFFLLRALQKKKTYHGEVFCWYVLLYGTFRTVIEGLRTDSLYFMKSTFRISQVVGLLSCLCCALWLLIRFIKRKKGTFFSICCSSLTILYPLIALLCYWARPSTAFALSFHLPYIFLMLFLLILWYLFPLGKAGFSFFASFFPLFLCLVSLLLFHLFSLRFEASQLTSSIFVFLSMALYPCICIPLSTPISTSQTKENHYAQLNYDD
ncbi:MAG: prolipoprotein diacylglyceryl transferase [Clostridiales bacterium]|nr:prolipoprotein diacylglyceryl transferase [Clostridiales bacterium]